METYGKVLIYVIPGFLALILIERLYGFFKGVNTIRHMDTISSLSSGMTNVIKDVLGLTFVIISYAWLEQHLSVFDLKATWWVFVLAFIGKDFSGYWVHRLQHSVNLFWNHHIIHHSSEEFNLPCALRQSFSIMFSLYALFLIPIAILGVPAEVVAVVAPIHLFAQFWYHTRLIGKMGFLEKIIVTPSHHRVHHAMNEEYLDKNLSQIFIIWDKLFGTFQEELEEVEPVYGVKRPVRTWNPIWINFQHLWLLIKDAWRTRSVWDKLRIWFMPTGWRPADVAEQYPVDTISDVYSLEKYDTGASGKLITWSWIQIVVNLLLMVYLFVNIADIGVPSVFVYGLFIVGSIFSYTTLMDRNIHAVWLEVLKSAIGLGLIISTGSWFGIEQMIPGGSYIVALYFIISALVVMALSFLEIRGGSRRPASAMAR